jgi:hypothetical protein
MSACAAQPLSALAATPVVAAPACGVQSTYYMTAGWGAYVLWFLIIAVITWFILYSLRPTWVQQQTNNVPNGQVDAGKTLLWSVIIALIIVLIVWLIRSSCRK